MPHYAFNYSKLLIRVTNNFSSPSPLCSNFDKLQRSVKWDARFVVEQNGVAAFDNMIYWNQHSVLSLLEPNRILFVADSQENTFYNFECLFACTLLHTWVVHFAQIFVCLWTVSCTRLKIHCRYCSAERFKLKIPPTKCTAVFCERREEINANLCKAAAQTQSQKTDTLPLLKVILIF